MDTLGLIGTIAGIIGTLTGIGGLVVAYLAYRFSKQQAKAQDEQLAQYRLEDNQPELCPVNDQSGSMPIELYFKQGTIKIDPKQPEQSVWLTNIGKGNAYKIYTTLSGCIEYENDASPPEAGEAFWKSAISGPILPHAQNLIKLRRSTFSLAWDYYDASPIKGYALCAPLSPSPREIKRGVPVVSARLAITYQDGYQHIYAGIFDFNHQDQAWQAVVQQQLVGTDLSELLTSVDTDTIERNDFS